MVILVHLRPVVFVGHYQPVGCMADVFRQGREGPCGRRSQWALAPLDFPFLGAVRSALGRGDMLSPLYSCGLGQVLLWRQSVSAGVPILGDAVSAHTVLSVL